MRALVQRVSAAKVTVDSLVTGEIGRGLCVFLGVKDDDTLGDAAKLAAKVTNLRIFSDTFGKMNLSLSDIGGSLLIVSQFTLYADLRSGNRPSYSRAAGAELAQSLYEAFITHCHKLCANVAQGVFQAHMQVHLINDGPVTILCEAGN